MKVLWNYLFLVSKANTVTHQIITHLKFNILQQLQEVIITVYF